MTSKWPLKDLKEVIWRSFGDSKLRSDKRNQLGVHKNLWKDILHAPKWDLVRKLCFQVLMGHLGHLEVIWRSFSDSKLKSDMRNRLGVHKNLWKDILHAPKWDLVRKLCFQVLMGHLRSFRGHLEVIKRLETQIWWAQSTQRPKKPMKRHVTCPKVKFGKKVMVWGH